MYGSAVERRSAPFGHTAKRVDVIPVVGREGGGARESLVESAVEREHRFSHLAPDRKQHRIDDVGHVDLPPNTLARDASDWFDRFLGPPRGNAR